MKYERLTERDDRDFIGIIGVDSAGLYKGLDMDESMFITRAIRRLAELEDKIENGELIERTSEEYSAVRKQAVEGFAEKLRDKEFSVKIGAEWFAVVKSRDIDELVKEE